MKTKIYTNKSNRIYRNGQLVQGLGSIFKKMYRDKAIDKKLYNYYNI